MYFLNCLAASVPYTHHIVRSFLIQWISSAHCIQQKRRYSSRIVNFFLISSLLLTALTSLRLRSSCHSYSYLLFWIWFSWCYIIILSLLPHIFSFAYCFSLLELINLSGCFLVPSLLLIASASLYSSSCHLILIPSFLLTAISLFELINLSFLSHTFSSA